MIKHFALLVSIIVWTPVHAECLLNASHGRGSVSNIPTAHIRDALTTEYTRVTAHVEGKSNINEIGVECGLGHGFYLSISHFNGLQASVDHELYLDGYSLEGSDVSTVRLPEFSFLGIKKTRITVPSFTLSNILPPSIDSLNGLVPRFKVLDIREQAVAEAWRISVVKHFDTGKISPYLKAGAEHARVLHRGTVPITSTTSLTYQKSFEITAPYVGLGVTYNRGMPVSFRAGVELLSVSPHYIWTWSVGIDIPLRFKP